MSSDIRRPFCLGLSELSDGLRANWIQAITWNDDDPGHWHMESSPDERELKGGHFLFQSYNCLTHTKL